MQNIQIHALNTFYFKVRMLTGLDVKYVNKNLIYVKQRKMKKSILHIFPASLLK